MCAGGRRPAREPSAPRAWLGASSRSPARPATAHRHRGRSLRRPPHRRRLSLIGGSVRRLEARPGPPPPTGTAAWPSGPSGALHTGGAWCAGVWLGALGRSPARLRSCLSNFARNSPANISNYEFVSLGFQRFWALLKLRAIELRATFLGVVTAVTRCSLWRPSHWCGLLCCCVCYSRIQLVFGTKFALRGLLVVTSVESSPCVGKTRQIGPFWVSRASFVPHMRCEGVCRASFVPPRRSPCVQVPSFRRPWAPRPGNAAGSRCGPEGAA